MLLFPKLRFPLALIGFAFAIAQAGAAITVTFSFDGADTIGVVSGSITLPQTPSANDSPNTGATFIDGNDRTLYVHVTGTPSYDFYSGGTNPSSVDISRPDQWSGTESFGFISDTLYATFSAVPGNTYAPTGTFTWSNQTLQQVGVSGITVPVVVYTASNGEEIRFVTTIPEPSLSGLVLGSAAFAAIGIRRRSGR